MASDLSDERLREIYARAVEARRDPARASCPSPDALLALVRREGSEETRLATLDHAMSCPDCRRDFELLRAIEGGRRADAEVEVRHLRWRRPLGISLAAIAAALLLVVLVPRWRAPGVADVSRGAGEDLVIVSPDDGDMREPDAPRFVWRALPGARDYTLEVLTGSGGVAATRTTEDTVVTLDINELAEGEYRWWVRARVDGGDRRSTARRLIIQR